MSTPRLSPRCSLLARFRRSEKGAVAPLIGIVMLVLIGCMGFAIDVGRSVLVRARLVDALDAAGLAVGARLSTTDYSADALKFVNANFKGGYAGATVTSVTATANSTKSVISLSATATVPTIFMKLFGQKSVTVNAASEVTRSTTGLEVVMVLDNTYSMELSNSMPGLKSAANSLVNILFGDSTTAKNLYVGLVPFSLAVNIGVSRKAWTDLNTVSRTGYPTYWTGCVEERLNGLDQTDDPPVAGSSTKIFRAFYAPDSWPGINDNNWMTAGWFGTTYSINYSNPVDPQGPGRYCPQELTPMTNVKSKVTSGISKMTAQGGTHINVGAVWGWRMLSPKWRGYWDGDMAANSLPLDYGTKNMSKAMILMTDGENTMYNDTYTAFGKLSDNRLGTTNDVTVAINTLNTRLKTICNSAKSAGIIVYTVAYDNPGVATKSLLQSCATSVAYYFDAGNQTALDTAFRTIGDSLSNLRVSK
ncbi:TadE/TadG family type IV pilus assembly protein [Hansschlegelia sp.]|uniref:TadE/TadG family type IV pilus assembly protein n=1 Tax=Hansschlegelia sp. TaxID=2041892 RepID=UPI002C396127|nr:TadE/TadG family type IV pilus assembly protein [Hansschlegelia sp.]HVI29300.1 TadE/TadG family type IV pilus assembly protein [Hansschlegelia sp.]